MPIIVYLRIMGGDLVETARDVVADVNADMGESFRPGSVVDRAGQIDWAAAGKDAAARAGGVLGKGLGGAMKVGGPLIIMMVADWFLDGALAMLNTKAGKPAADALARLGDVMLDVLVKVLRPLIPLLLRAIKAIYPVLQVALDILGALGEGAASALVPALELMATVLELGADLMGKLKRGLERIGRALGGAWALIHNKLVRIQRAIDGAVAGVAGAIGRLLTFILDSILAPIKGYLDGISESWDAFHEALLGEGSIRHPMGYMWDDVWYEWGTGPLGESPHPGSRVIEHPASEAQLVAALGAYSRANGGIARALWSPA